MASLKVRTLENSLGPQALASIPPEVKREIMEEIRQFIEDNLDS